MQGWLIPDRLQFLFHCMGSQKKQNDVRMLLMLNFSFMCSSLGWTHEGSWDSLWSFHQEFWEGRCYMKSNEQEVQGVTESEGCLDFGGFLDFGSTQIKPSAVAYACASGGPYVCTLFYQFKSALSTQQMCCFCSWNQTLLKVPLQATVLMLLFLLLSVHLVSHWDN